MGLLDDHRILVTGVLTDDSLAFGIAKRALEEGATVALSGAGRGLSLTKRTARKLADVGEIVELDVTDPSQVEAAAAELTTRFGRLDGLVHAIGMAPPSCLGNGMFVAPFDDVADGAAHLDLLTRGVGRRLPTALAKERGPRWRLGHRAGL